MDFDFSSLWETLQSTLMGSVPGLLMAIAILIGGWLIAVIVRALVRRGLGMLHLNRRISSEAQGELDIEGGVSRGAYYVVLLLALIAFFDALDLPMVSQPLQSLVEKLLAFLPNLVAGGVLMLIAWLLATVLRRLVTSGLSSTTLDEKLTAEAGMNPFSRTAGNVLYGLILLLFLPAVLGALKLEGLLEPVRGMVGQMLDMLPSILAGAVFAVVGWFVARLIRSMIEALAQTAGADTLGERAGLSGTMTLSKLLGLMAFVLVFVPALIQALDTLQMEAISTPATQVLGTFMSALPKILTAAVILSVAFLVSRFVAELATKLLGGIGFDSVPSRLGVARALPEGGAPSAMVGKLIIFFVMLFAVVESANVLGFSQIAGLVDRFIQFGGQVLLGVVIIAVGLWMANLAHGTIVRFGRPQAALMANLARFAILGMVFAMGLRAMDLANEIVDAAFYLTLGAIAVAVALSFGLGGREAAGKQMEYWLSRTRGGGSDSR